MRDCTRTTSATSISWTRASSRSFVNLAGALNTGLSTRTDGVRPAGHIWMRSAHHWFRPDPDDLLYEQQPTDYMALIERFGRFQQFSGQRECRPSMALGRPLG